jgi:hypothetical protein
MPRAVANAYHPPAGGVEMRRIGLIALFLAIAAATAAVARTAASKPSLKPSAKTCGGLLWHMKTFSDRQRNTVDMRPRETTIADIAKRPPPYPLPRTRRTKFQRQVYRVVAQITEYRLDGNELRLILFDHGSYMNAVVPAPGCLTRHTRARGTVAGVWSTFLETCGHHLDRSWQPQGGVAFVDGVGFWSSRFKNRRGAAANGAELHPVTGLRSVSGCGSS